MVDESHWPVGAVGCYTDPSSFNEPFIRMGPTDYNSTTSVLTSPNHFGQNTTTIVNGTNGSNLSSIPVPLPVMPDRVSASTFPFL
ncbi:unnamed protein product [Echinostoma caproni]|uniref:Ovule protein n=1 Tax=Echinostoma caproni TaxID=27848 RepID=A0A183A3Z4_9TREM|nr:unnamed protein product [Echinostoma caproni]